MIEKLLEMIVSPEWFWGMFWVGVVTFATQIALLILCELLVWGPRRKAEKERHHLEYRLSRYTWNQ